MSSIFFLLNGFLKSEIIDLKRQLFNRMTNLKVKMNISLFLLENILEVVKLLLCSWEEEFQLSVACIVRISVEIHLKPLIKYYNTVIATEHE